MTTSATEKAAMLQPDITWEPVIPFNDVETPDIPASFLPGWAGAFVREVSACAQTPEGFATMLGFSTLATCLQGQVVVAPYGDSYQEPVNIWTAGVMPPGARKSFVQDHLTKPLVDWEIEQSRVMQPEIDKAETVRAITLRRIDRLEHDGAKEADASIRDQIAKEIVGLKESLPPIRRAPQLFTSDCTAERFQSLLLENNERMSVLSDEGGIFEVMGGLYNDGRVNVDVFLQSHAGSRVRVNRTSRDAWLEHPLSTFGLAVQPAVIEDLSHGGKRQLRGRGCLARFLYNVPASNIGKRDVITRRSISDEVRYQYHAGIRRLLDSRDSNQETPAVWTLDRDALLSWVSFHAALEIRQGENGDLHGISDWTAKLPGALLRLAALCHAVEYGLVKTVIPRSTIEKCLDLADLLIQHALCAFSLMGSEPSITDAKHVARWIQRQNTSPLKLNAIYRGCHGRIQKMDRLQKAISGLIDHNILSEPTLESTGGRPSPWLSVNPEFLEAKL